MQNAVARDTVFAECTHLDDEGRGRRHGHRPLAARAHALKLLYSSKDIGLELCARPPSGLDGRRTVMSVVTSESINLVWQPLGMVMSCCDSQNRLHVLHEHSTSIKSLAIHATKPYVLSASRDGKILLWDYGKDRQLIKTFDANSWLDKGEIVEQVAFHPKDNDLFASAQGNTVKFWNLHSGECKHILSGHSDSVVCLDYFNLGHKLYWITGSQDRTAKIWDCETWRCVHSLKGHMDVVNIACCHPDLPVLITGSWDGTLNTRVPLHPP
uniref:Putative coatomer subunit beta'-3 n=1 Tax=Aegilops tauschii TaxID=37682 RepID=M8C5A1_AEGTA